MRITKKQKETIRENIFLELLRLDKGVYEIYLDKKEFRCIVCNKLLIEGKNIHYGYHLNICKPCRINYLESEAEERLDRISKFNRIRDGRYEAIKQSKEKSK